MTSYLEKLNLRPNERRMVVIVALVVFVVLNIWFVWPRFGDWKIVRAQIEKARKTLETYQAEIAREPIYKAREKELGLSGSEILSKELDLQRMVQTAAGSAGVMLPRIDPRPRAATTATNQFYEHQVLSVDYLCGGKELIDFLVNIAAGNSLIRVKELNVHPDSSQTKLSGNILFVASYQMKPAAPAPSAAKTATNNTAKPAAKPPENTVAKTSAPAAKAPQPPAKTAATNKPPVAGAKNISTNSAPAAPPSAKKP